MIEATRSLTQLVSRFEPALPLDQLIPQVNNLYHRYEAAQYDHSHPEVHEQLPPIWWEMAQQVMGRDPDKSWHVLDFGCGTGFEAGEILRSLGVERIASLTCYDPSPEMLDHCRRRLYYCGASVQFCSDWEAVRRQGPPPDLVLTNSLLHHLPDPVKMLSGVADLAAPGAIWLSGHEPSRRYYANPECRRVLARYRSRELRRKLLDPGACFRHLRVRLGLDGSPASRAAAEAFRQGLFRRKPSTRVVTELVDVHVPHSADEAGAGRGFDFAELEQQFAGRWELAWIKSYAFLGPYYESGLPPGWRTECARLAGQFPNDGANFCAVWRRA